MKTTHIEDVTYYIANKITLPKGKIGFNLILVYGLGMYSVCHSADGSYSDWTDCYNAHGNGVPS